MKFTQSSADLFIPDAKPEARARLGAHDPFGRIGAHHDDLEFMAAHYPILKGFSVPGERWFTRRGGGRTARAAPGTVSNADVQRRPDGGSAPPGAAQGRLRRRLRGATTQLGHPSSNVKDPAHKAVPADHRRLGRCQTPRSCARSTPTTWPTSTRPTSALPKPSPAIRRLEPKAERPSKLVGCEVWRDLDWMNDQDKVVMNLDGHENLADALMGVFDSQICGGKRYDLATRGRRKAHATYFESHATDQHTALIWGMDLTPLMHGGDPATHVTAFMKRFEDEVLARVSKLSG